MTTRLRVLLRSADPARDVTGYDDDRCRTVIDLIVRQDATDVPTTALDIGLADPADPADRADPAPQGRRYRRMLPLGFAAAAAAAAAAVLVMAPSLLPWFAGGASASAAAVLRQAAAVTASDPAASGRQYWRIVTSGTQLMATTEAITGTAGTGTAGAGPAGGGTAGGGTAPTSSAYLVTSTRIDYVAVDGTRPTWTEQLPTQRYRQISGPPGTPPESPLPPAWTTDLSPADRPASWQGPTPAFLAGLPRDSAALRTRLYQDSKGQGNSADGEALVFVADLLRSGLVPADLRAALYRVLVTVPDVEVTASSVTVGSHTGVAIGRSETVNGIRQELVVDPGTGEVVAERDILTEARDGIAAGTAIEEVQVSRTLVDDVPAEVRAKAEHQHCTAGPGGAVACSLPGGKGTT